MLLQEESHKDLSESNNIAEPMIFAIEKRKYYEKRKKSNYLCKHCKIAGHSVERWKFFVVNDKVGDSDKHFGRAMFWVMNVMSS